MRSISSKTLNNIFITSSSDFFILIIGFLSLPILVQRLGVENFGILIYARMFSGMGFLVLFDLGISAALPKFIAEYCARDLKSEIGPLLVGSTWLLAFIGGIFGTIGWYLTPEIVSFMKVPTQATADLVTAIKWSFIVWVIELPGLAIYSAIDGYQRFVYSKAIDIAWILSYTILSIVLCISGHGFLVISLAALVLSLIKLVVGFYLLCRCQPNLLQSWLALPRQKDIYKQLKLGRHLFIANLSSTLSAHGERAAVAVLLTPSMMTAYEVLVKLPRMIKSNFTFGANTILPLASELSVDNDFKRNRELFEKGLILNLIAVTPVVAISILLAAPFLRLWMGTTFESLTPLLQILLLFNLINPLSSFGWPIMVGINRKVYWIPIIQWFCLAYRGIAWFVFMPLYGMWAMVASFFPILFTIPISVAVPCKELGSSYSYILIKFLQISAICFIPIIFLIFFNFEFYITNFISLVLVSIIFLIVLWMILFNLILDKKTKIMIFNFLQNKYLIFFNIFQKKS